MEGDEPSFDWDELVPRIVHPLKVAIIEALLWIDTPLSASELDKVLGGRFGISLVSYHVTKLAEAEAITKVGERPVRGALQTFYFFPGQEWASRALRFSA
ncbi:MAG: helix-turn-helix domain-containing protein [Solirubrobacterales bacterium]